MIHTRTWVRNTTFGWAIIFHSPGVSSIHKRVPSLARAQPRPDGSQWVAGWKYKRQQSAAIYGSEPKDLYDLQRYWFSPVSRDRNIDRKKATIEKLSIGSQAKNYISKAYYAQNSIKNKKTNIAKILKN